MQKLTPENAKLLSDLSEHTVYLMGGSFVLGSLFTIFLLLMLDFARHLQADKDPE
ncbi:MAG: hypothetical protein SFX19_03270 [Alphaproteobacteria bacterium]|nr:hypothetical protein [Alphaproteobacteria bacterium]